MITSARYTILLYISKKIGVKAYLHTLDFPDAVPPATPIINGGLNCKNNLLSIILCGQCMLFVGEKYVYLNADQNETLNFIIY